MKGAVLYVSAAGWSGAPNDVGTVAAPLMGPHGAFIPGGPLFHGWRSHSAYWCELKPK
jgi:hypothetical protein